MTQAFTIALLGISVLLGLGCLAMFVVAVIGWDQFSFATTVRFPRMVVLVAGLLGAALFLGGPVALAIRKGRPFGTTDHDDDGGQGPDDNE